MSWGIDGGLGTLIADGFEEIAASALHKLKGESVSKASEEAIKRMVDQAMRAGLNRLEQALQWEAEAIGLAFELVQLGSLTEHVMDAFKVKGDIPALGLDIEVMPPDWKPEE